MKYHQSRCNDCSVWVWKWCKVQYPSMIMTFHLVSFIQLLERSSLCHWQHEWWYHHRITKDGWVSAHRNDAKFKLQLNLCSQKSNRVLLESSTTYVWISIMIIHCLSYTNICCNKNLLYTGSHGVVSIRHNFVCNHKRCRFLVFRNFAWGKLNALKENLSEKQFFKQIFDDLKKIGNEINSGIIIPLFL